LEKLVGEGGIVVVVVVAVALDFAATPLFQTSFFPLLMQVNLIPLVVRVNPALRHAELGCSASA
jgi:hypothetical protein